MELCMLTCAQLRFQVCDPMGFLGLDMVQGLGPIGLGLDLVLDSKGHSKAAPLVLIVSLSWRELSLNFH